MKRFYAFFIVSLVAFAPATSMALKIGTVDLQKALQESKKGKAAKSNLEKEFEARKKKIDAEQDSIRKESEDFQKKSMVLSEKARAEKGMQLQARMGAWQELVQKSQGEIQQKEVEMTKPIIEGLRELTNDLAKKKDVELVYEANAGLLYAKDRVDLTPDLIKAYDEKNPK